VFGGGLVNRRSSFALVAAVCLAAGSALAADPPDFSGEWVLDLGRSTLVKPGIRSGSVRIVHREPAFSFARTFVTEDGPDQVSYELTTDGKEKVEASDGMTTRSRLYWQDDQLVLDETMTMGERTATNVVHYSLSDGGRTLTARESFHGPRLKYDNTWVFFRQ
jgi:hypothetical protein